MKKALFTLGLICTLVNSVRTQNPPNSKVVLQAFWWDYWNSNYPEGWSAYLIDLAPRLKNMGIDAVWIPPTYKNTGINSVGYSPFDHYDLGDKYQKGETATRVGNKNDLLKMIAVFHSNGIEVIQDVVLNHVDNAGSAFGAGGQDQFALTNYDDGTTGGYKNFRYVCYETPATDESESDYLNRKGRWSKNWTNFYPNQFNACCNNDLNSVYWGPDISYEGNAYGGSSCSNCYNPAQSENYMRDEARNWFIWYKKQTGVDGYRFDAVKHFSTAVVEDLLFNAQNNAGFASGGSEMFAVGEFVGGGNQLDDWANATQNRAGTFDFSLREGIYAMVQSGGLYNLAQIPSLQQNNRQRTSPFVNNHDTFRPQFDNNGNYVGWNTGDELAPHINPFDPRIEAAHAIMFAVDGAPIVFMEDLFNLSNSNRFWHDPQNETDLPVRSALENIIWCHQKLEFKTGAYNVRFQAQDHLVIERSAKAIISVNDNWTDWQTATIQTNFAAGTQLHDYSGANSNDVFVDVNGQVQISTPPCDGSNIRRGYSIWGPAGISGGFSPSKIVTQQEWEMANDLGDSHSFSLQQGGALQPNSIEEQYVGRIYCDTGIFTIDAYPTSNTEEIELLVYDVLTGSVLQSVVGVGNLVLSYSLNTPAEIDIKIRNVNASNLGQVVRVKASYYAPDKIIETSVGLESIFSNDLNVSIYPNPTKGVFEVKCSNASQVNATIKILNVTGKVLLEDKVNLNSSVSKNISSFSPGIYFVKLQSGNREKVTRIIKY